MPKASFKLSDGTEVTIDGSLDELERLVKLYSAPDKDTTTQKKRRPRARQAAPRTTPPSLLPDSKLLEIVNIVHTCAEADAIEAKILRSNSQLDRAFLPLYIVQKYEDPNMDLSAKEISIILEKLRIRLANTNVYKTIREKGERYVLQSKDQAQGKRYKLNLRGVQYFENVLFGARNDQQG